MKKKQTQKTILIAEDDPSLMKALSDKFTREGFKILKANDGKAGLAKALKYHPDLIVLDIAMPKMDGVSMMKELRKDEWGKDVYIVLLTNVPPYNEAVAEEAIRSPYVSSYLMKSDYNISDIVKLVKGKFKK